MRISADLDLSRLICKNKKKTVTTEEISFQVTRVNQDGLNAPTVIVRILRYCLILNTGLKAGPVNQ